MHLNKKNFLVAAGLAACALQAQAGLSFSEMAAPPGPYTAPAFTTPDATLAYVASDSVVNVRLAPLGVAGNYLVVTSGGSATVLTGGAASYSFVWGSPDTFNFIDVATSDGAEHFSGSDLGVLGGFTPNGSNANTSLFTLAGVGGTTIDSITFGSEGVAFELAVAPAMPVPEPQSFALMLAGLAALGIVARRRRRNDA